jgi:enoyl-CoA hydratase/carnithine racemase
MTDNASHITQKQDGAILHLGFNRPERKNAITGDMYQTLADALTSAATDDSVRVVVARPRYDVYRR